MEEAAQSLDRYRDSISYDEERYAYCQDRDSVIYGLKKKYGETVQDILNYEEKAQQRLEELESEVCEQGALEQQLAEKEKVAKTALAALISIRRENADVIAKQLRAEIVDLGMEKGDIRFFIDESEELLPLGAKSIELLFTANKGEQLLPCLLYTSPSPRDA